MRQPSTFTGRCVVGAADGMLHECCENGSQTVLLVCGCDDVDGVVACKPGIEVDVASCGVRRYARVGPAGEDVLHGGEYRPTQPRLLVPQGSRRRQRSEWVGTSADRRHAGAPLAFDE